MSHPIWLVAPYYTPATQALPSGQSADLYEVLVDDVGTERWLRFRFLAPGIAKSDIASNFEDVQRDFEHLCSNFAVAYIDEFKLVADVVVISLLDRPVEFGVADPDATQLIEAFRITGDDCEWGGLW